MKKIDASTWHPKSKPKHKKCLEIINFENPSPQIDPSQGYCKDTEPLFKTLAYIVGCRCVLQLGGLVPVLRQ